MEKAAERILLNFFKIHKKILDSYVSRCYHVGCTIVVTQALNLVRIVR